MLKRAVIISVVALLSFASIGCGGGSSSSYKSATAQPTSTQNTAAGTSSVSSYINKALGQFEQLNTYMDETHDAEAAGDVETAKSAKAQVDKLYGEIVKGTAPAGAQDLDMALREYAAAVTFVAAYYQDMTIAKAEGDTEQYERDQKEIVEAIEDVETAAQNLDRAIKSLEAKYK